MKASRILFRPMSFTRKYIVDQYITNHENAYMNYFLRRAVFSKNSELIKVMDKSEMLTTTVKKEVFQELCYFSDYSQLEFLMDNVVEIRHNLEDYIKYVDICSRDVIDKKNIEENLKLLEQELN